MCLVAIAWKVHPYFPLIISANRDEAFQRPTAPLHQWNSGFFAGKDLSGGGTWMGFHPNGKWSLLTNYRDFSQKRNPKISRGKLVSDFLESALSPEDYLDKIWEERHHFDGFNLLVSDGDKLHYASNYAQSPKEIPAGIHGLSNGLLNDPWPKTELAKNQLSGLMSGIPTQEQLLQTLKSTATYPPEILPKTGAPLPLEIGLSAQLIRIEPDYGTVSSTAALRHRSGFTEITERSFDWDYRSFKDQNINFQP
ncbi:MAG: NRDE family protein [Algoriphagus sp.]|jgi:uncharacterized protein with NRDE domain|nr:NRDE family protein [Algoriphagus sp.]